MVVARKKTQRKDRTAPRLPWPHLILAIPLPAFPPNPAYRIVLRRKNDIRNGQPLVAFASVSRRGVPVQGRVTLLDMSLEADGSVNCSTAAPGLQGREPMQSVNLCAQAGACVASTMYQACFTRSGCARSPVRPLGRAFSRASAGSRLLMTRAVQHAMQLLMPRACAPLRCLPLLPRPARLAA